MTLDQAFEQLKTLAETEVRQVAEGLHLAVRGLRKAETESEIARLLIESPQRGHSVCVTFEGTEARVGPTTVFAVHDAPALVSVIESGDTIVTSATRKELSEPLFLDLDAEGRVHLIPIVVQGAVRMILAATDLVDSAALETLCEVAGLRLEAIGRKEEPPPPVSKWDGLSPADQSLHLRAQRFAQVAVARMRVEESAAVRTGLQRGDLYSALRESIDQTRAEYKQQYLSGQSKTMVDYLYVELVRSLANDEDRLLGAGFPGRLI